MVPDKFNMVDMEGIDLLFSYGDIIPGLYQKLVESITPCRYQCLYNWYFVGVLIPPTYVEMTVNQDTNDVWINDGVFVTSDDCMLLHLPSLETVSGSIVNITDALSRRVKELICYINPVQSGSGDPSPNNIRPIIGYSLVNIYNEETYDSTAAPKLTVNWQIEAGTIYGCTLKLNEDGSADLVEEWISDVLNGRYDLAWGPTYSNLDNTSAILFYWSSYPVKRRDNANEIPHILCPSLPVISKSSIGTYDDDSISCVINGDGVFGIELRLKAFKEMTTVSQARAYLQQNPVNIVYLLREDSNLRHTYHLDDIGELYTHLGTNTIWHDGNGDISVTYWK